MVSARWIRENGRFRLDVELPPNTTAEVRIPTGGRTAQVTGDGAVFRGVRGDRATCSVASGRHTSIARDTPEVRGSRRASAANPMPGPTRDRCRRTERKTV
ncbi:alpha-L-rhamnosidase C-terminal domain-containing protein [Streptomyces canus]|uniref:alpha-L-rhamnosidase C-terminal domain-containing protein n=1 Tax=Streptomyces canus TaxID=58343 RepID=UPI002E268CA8